MSVDLMTLKMLVVCEAADARELLRAGATLAPLPVDIAEAETALRAGALLSDGAFDIALVDGALDPDARRRIAATARKAARPPLLVTMCGDGEAMHTDGAQSDAVAARPVDTDGARRLVDGCARVRLPNRLLIVDDSQIMRSIVKKILGATSFTLEIAEASEGVAALELIARRAAEIVFLDYNMPGLDGVATLTQIRNADPDVRVVIMTAAHDDGIDQRAREAGANGFLRKPFYPADVDAMLWGLFGFTPPARPAAR